MAEYAEAHKLELNLHDAGATRLLAAHLRKKGYVPRRRRWKGKIAFVWSKTDAKYSREKLKQQLEKLK